MSNSPGNTRTRGAALLLVAAMAALAPVLADASSIIRSFAQRYQITGRADSVLIGNQLLNCPTSASGCTTARNGTGNNNNFNMGYVDVDGIAGTFNSSMAPLSIPAGSTVQRAYLYWGADTSAGSSGSAAPTPASRNQVRFSAAGGAYVTVTAGTVDVTGSRFSAIADVTALVAGGGSGNYMVANVQAGTGGDRYAGWGLVVIYSNPALPLRSLTLFDGSLNINTSSPSSITTTVSGFRTPATGAVDARIGLIAFEGDNNFTGDQFLVNGSNISDALNPTTNIFNSTNSRLGVAQTGRNPQQSNMLGFDVDYIPVAAGVIANNDTSASLTFTTSSETYYPIALLFQTNVYEPEIVTNFSKAATDLNGGQFRPGDIVEYTIALSNTGDDAADETVITDPLPLGLTYVPGTIEIVAGPNAGPKTDAAGDDQAEYNAGTRTITVRVGTGANTATGGRIAPVPQANSSTSVRFRAQIDAIQPDGAALANIAGIAYVGATSGTPSSGNTPPATVTVSRDADLAITKSGPASVVAGAPIQYTLTVTSLGPDAADGAIVTDNVPAGITGVVITCAASGGATCPDTTGLGTLAGVALPSLPSGGQVVFTIDGTAPMAATTLNNSASVAAPTGTNDPTPGNNSDGPVTTTVDAGLDLEVTGSLVTTGTIRTGDPVAYQFTVTNNGPVVAPGAPFDLPMPTGLAGASWTCAPLARCGVGAGTGDIALSLSLGVGESVTIDFGGTAPATTPATLGDAVGTVAAPAGLGDSNPANNSATVSAIVVQARDIVAGADSGSVVNGSVGGTAVADVLANDQFDGAPATLADVTLSQVSTTHPGVTLDPATGAITVAPGTPTGSYTVVYQICETANPGNCTQASVTVDVTNTPPSVQDDAATVVESSTGNAIDVLANDTDAEDGAPVVTPASGATANGGSFTCTATGCSYTPPVGFVGSDTFTYEACDTAGECDTATVTVTVQARTLSITATPACIADAAYLDYSISGGNFDATGLDATIEWLDGGGNVISTLPNQPLSGQLLWPGMVLTAGTPTDWPGWVLVGGLWVQAPDGFEGLRPDATVRITVNPTEDVLVAYPPATPSCAAEPPANLPPVATDDADGTIGLAPVTTNVLANDSDPEAGPLAVTIATPPASGAVVVNPDGSITYTPAAGFQGVVTYDYTITDAAGLTDTATVTITVAWLVIDAVDDSGSVANGAAGGTAIADVLANDTFDGAPATLANVTLAQVSTTNPNVTLDPATGVVSVAPGTPAGTYTVVYQICEVLNPSNCDQASVTVTVGAAVIDAVDDTGTVASGAAGGTAVPNVLVNDTLGGAPATLANATLSQVSTTNPNVTLDPATGAVNVAPGTPAGTYTVTYQVCEQLNPTNCDTAAVTVTVGAAVIDAVDDTGTVASGAAGGTAVPNVLVNDTLSGAPATLATVALSQVSTTNPNVTLDVATGAVNVAPGTPAGTYTVVYQLCEQLNPTNCDQASITVTVGAAVIDAVGDTGTVASGAAGGTAVPNVLVNDTLDGNPATLATVTLSQVSTTNPNVTLDPATGAVNVAPGTPAGTYTVVYQLCEQLNPTSCDTASVTVTVGAAVIDAVDDTGTVASGAAGGTAVANVLVNDTLSGAPATLATVALSQVSTTNPNVTLDVATGAVNVAPGTPAGTYTVNYQICEILNPTNCDTASVTVTVGTAVIDAVDDTGTVASGATGGTAVPNVLVNDTLAGAPATLANVTLTQVSTTNPNVTLDPATGAVNVAPGTPAGTYTVVYQVCEQLNPTNCDQASVTATVGAAVIDAVDDTGTLASGATGGTAVPNVLVNDTLDGNPATLANVTLTQVSTTNPNVTLDVATGAVNVAPGTPAGTYTVVYQICELLNPTNCDTASVTVTVGAAVIDAVDDTGTVPSGTTGGTAVPNVLVNDTLDGNPATLGNVTLTQVSTSNPNVTLDPATGAVNVASGTPAGTYTVVYQVCEILNPTNCDTATVTVTVGAAVIDAVDDTGSVASGAAGGTAVPNVLVNDTLGGIPATLATVNLSQVSTSNPNVTLDPATGAVNVAPGTPAGTYTVVYQICEILNPTNCDTATATVTVGAAVIDAVDDTGSVASGAAGGVGIPNVLVNDTLDGSPATLATVTLTQVSTNNPNVTLNPATGAVEVAAGTPAGTYTVVYQICEQLNPANCDTASVTITVDAAVIDAVDDTGTVASGATGGTAVPNVLVNDTLDGAPATLANTTLSQVSTSNPNVTLDVATGAVNVAPGTPAGTYTVNYQICEQLNPTNCDTATVTVTVGAAVIDAVDDTGTVASGAAGGTAVPNVLVNDTLGGIPATLATVNLSQVSTSNPNVTLDPATGAVNVAPGTPAGTYTVVYQICEILNPTNCDTATVTVTVGSAVIDAVDDTGTVASGAAGGTAIPSVLVNDTLDGNPATLANVTLTQVSTSNPNVTLDPATGAVNVAPGTPAGTYTVVYQICEILNPTNCDSATATVMVGTAVIDAVDDTGGVASGAAGGTAVPNVLVNDTLDGAPATLANVTLTQVSTTNPNVTLDVATGAVNVAPGTPAGTYTVVYQICEILNPTNCDMATATVTVGAAAIDAVNDTGSVASGAAGGVGIPNVLVNDTLDGAPATLATVTLTQVSTSNPNVTLDVATGAVNVAPGTPAGTYTVVYQLCEQLNPTNCDTATVTVTVGAAVIDAVDDTGTVASGAAGGTAVPNVLVNDTLDGAPATLANVTLTQVSTTNPNVTLDVATGAVSVAPGTPAGTYTVVYQICEVLNPTNCDTATATVTVGAAVIDAVDDTGTVASGAAGGTAVPNVLVNDTLDGSPATLATVTLAQVSTTNPNVTLDVATGAVNVAPGTPAGTYTVVYQICEILNPTNCDTATVTVTVGSAVIDAVDDTGTVASGAAGGTAVPSVLVNDTLDGNPATLATVTLAQVSTTNPNVTLDVATGAVSVAPGTPAGTYTVVYQICEVLNPTNCDTATATVTVGAAVIDAVDDTGTVASGAAGGTAVPSVLVNDTLDGNPATLANVTLTQVTTSNPNVTLDPATGAVNVAPGTPAGTYTVVYQLCEILNPTNCDTATVTVTVGAAVIDAVDDSGTVASGAAGGTAVPNVLVNDTLDGNPATLANVTLTQVTTSNPNVTLDPATGAVNVAPGTPAGTYTVVYQICEILNPTNCDSATATVMVGTAVIDAVDDTGSVASGAAGGTAVPNVLVNDTLDGAPATLANVTLTQVSTTNPNVTLDVATGAVNVAPGTPAGTYTVVYQICEILNPTNCDTATATVTVGAAVIDAVDDTGSVASGAAGGVGIPNVLVNDTLDGAPATLATVTLAQVSTSNTNVTLNVSTGAVNVAPGTPAGTYTVVYQICEILNPTNCDTATATVTVGAAVIDAVDDAGSLTTTAGGVGVPNVLANDTLDGAPANLATVTLAQVSTSDPNVTLDPATGAVNVAPGTPAGTYTVVYQICEILNPANCDTAAATVTVIAPALAAADDAGSTAQNTPVSVPVLGNDSFGGAPAGTTDVVVTIVSGPSNGSAVVNPDGSITYTPAANYSGPDQLRYRICGVVNPAVCEEAVVDLVVAPNTVIAPDDAVVTAQATPVTVPLLSVSSTGGGAPLDPASLAITTPPANGTVVINADGTATYVPNTLFFGTDSFEYRVCDQSVPVPVCDTGIVTITIEMAAPQLRISKTTPATTVRVGDFVRYSVVVENVGISPANNTTVMDVPPAGFTYVDGSLVVVDADGITGLAGTQPLRITGVDIPVGGTATIGYLLRIGAGTGPGEHVNTATAVDITGASVSNVASAAVMVEGDPMLEESLILGTVFVDLDGDGRQQAGEPGLAGVRLATVEGLVVETDVHGRFHLVGIDGGHALRGRNAIVKVDVATLPPGSTFTTPNPLVRRITPGIPVRFDFGVRLPAEGSDAAPETR